MRVALILALNSCYRLSFGDKELREKYDEHISSIKVGIHQVSKEEIQSIIQTEYDRYI